MGEELDIKRFLLIRKLCNKYITENPDFEDLTSSFAVFAEALYQKEFHSQQELTEFIGCNKAHTSRIIFKMQLKGLIKICSSCKDKKLILSEKGKEFAEVVIRRKQKLMKLLFNNITKENKETFFNVLNQIIEKGKDLEEV